MSIAVAIQICAITAGIKKHKSIMKKRKKNDDKIVLSGKDKLNTIEVLISKASVDTYISHDKFVSLNHLFNCLTVTTVNFISDIVFIFCSYSVLSFTQSYFSVESRSYFIRSDYTS